MANIIIPEKLEERLFSSNKPLADNLKARLTKFANLLSGDKLEFFIEYTDHSIDHINKVLRNIEDLMITETINKLNSQDVSIIIVAVILHDIGMKATIELFQNILKGSYDYGQPEMPKGKNLYDDKPWKEVWNDYLKESQFWNEEKKLNVTGDRNYIIAPETNEEQDTYKQSFFYKINHPADLTISDRRFIGEFIRIHHGRIGYEVAIKGYIGNDGHSISFKDDTLNDNLLQLAGIVARSHSIGLRENYKYLTKLSDIANFKSPSNIDIGLHMVLIRLSDYLHIDKNRTNETVLYLRKTYSPYSLNEHKKHLAISNIKFKEKEENISVTVTTPIESAELFVSLERLIHDIQSEFDSCWAVLGELYSDTYKLKYRSITSNLSQEGVRKMQTFVPKQFGFRFNSELTKLLIAPLYGDDPSYGVRELVQNAVDACRTRMAIDEKYNNKKDFTHVTVSIDTKSKLFTIVDSGIGMTIEEIEKYFLTIGSSFSNSTDWQIIREEEEEKKEINNIYRTGHFGIGILAAFLLGDTITVETKSLKNYQGYKFTVSLQGKFVQIDRIEIQDIGTRITINCKDEQLARLKDQYYIGFSKQQKKVSEDYTEYKFWYNYYVDDIPVVQYLLDNNLINHRKDNTLNGFIELKNYPKDKFEVLWKPQSYYWENGQHNTERNPLFCNGFFITASPFIHLFNLSDLQKYFFITIPSLYINDRFNLLPLNLRRDDIDRSHMYPFEIALAQEVYKDLMCRLCAIELDYFNRKYLCYSATGFALNQHLSFPFSFGKKLITKEDYKDNYLNNKTVVSIICTDYDAINKIEIDRLKSFLNAFPDYVFYFYKDSYILNNHVYVDEYKINDWLKQYICIAVNKSYSSHLSFNRAKLTYSHKHTTYRHRYNDNATILKDYDISGYQDQYGELLASIRILFEKNNYSSPPYILIQRIKRESTSSDLDNFFKEYADGDMIIPYDDEERRKKFAKLYDECSDEIERYQELYKNGTTRR